MRCIYLCSSLSKCSWLLYLLFMLEFDDDQVIFISDWSRNGISVIPRHSTGEDTVCLQLLVDFLTWILSRIPEISIPN